MWRNLLLLAFFSFCFLRRVTCNFGEQRSFGFEFENADEGTLPFDSQDDSLSLLSGADSSSVDLSASTAVHHGDAMEHLTDVMHLTRKERAKRLKTWKKLREQAAEREARLRENVELGKHFFDHGGLTSLSQPSSIYARINWSTMETASLDNYPVYKSACVHDGLIVGGNSTPYHKTEFERLDSNTTLSILIEAPDSWFEKRHNFYHLSTLLFPAAAFTQKYPGKFKNIYISVDTSRGWLDMTFVRWLVTAIRSKGLPFIAIKRASAVCLENVVYIDEKSYLGRWPQPFVRDFILEHCNVTAAPLRPNTALIYRRLNGPDTHSKRRELTDIVGISDALRRRGFSVQNASVPLDFCAQAALVASGFAVLVSPHGAQLSMAMLAANGTKVIEFYPDRYRSYLFCGSKFYVQGMRYYNVLYNHEGIHVNEDCAPREDWTPLPGCVHKYPDGFCCRRCASTRDRPVTIRLPERVLEHVIAGERRPLLVRVEAAQVMQAQMASGSNSTTNCAREAEPGYSECRERELALDIAAR